MTTTASELQGLLDRVNEASKLLQTATAVPEDLAELIDSFDPTLHAATPLRVEADPYLLTTLWAAAFRAEKALRHDSVEQQRREVRVALEQFRHALRDIVANRPYGDDADVREIVARTVDVLAAPQKEVADLFGVSTRQLQRWLAGGSRPQGGDAARARIVGQVVNQLRHTFTAPGVLSWFHHTHPVLGVSPVDLLDDAMGYPRVLSAATGSRAMVG